MSAFAPPSGPPPSHAASSSASNTASAAIPNNEDPFDPPPAYTPSANAGPDTGTDPHGGAGGQGGGNTQGEVSLASGPSRMDFSGPPPIPDRLQHNITGVGVGYGSRIGGDGGSSHNPFSPQHMGMTHQPTGQSMGSGFGGGNGEGGYRPPPPPQHPSHSYSYSAPSHPPPPSSSSNSNSGKMTSPIGPPPSNTSSGSGGGAGPSSGLHPPHVSNTLPTEVPTPGRPLLHRGQLLVYPKGHWCHKCGNTGYKANDPNNPHEADWKKYGKPYNSALSTSYISSSKNASHNPLVTSSANFQRPLPSFQPQPGPGPNTYGHLPPPPPPPQPHQGGWGTYPGHQAHHSQFAPPLPPPQQNHYYGGQQVFVQRGAGVVPPNALVVYPGDPRIGGRPCHRCGGSGREVDFFFGFDEGKCYACRGLGRLF